MTLDSDHRDRLSHPANTLRSACLTLQRTSPADVRSIFLAIPLMDLPLPASSAVALAERIADEYGMVARAQVNGQSLDVWLSRALVKAVRKATWPTDSPPRHASEVRHSDSDGELRDGKSNGDAETSGILIADEEAGLRRLIAERLARRGFCAREAKTAREALDAIYHLPPDLLLLDVNLPDRSGWDVLRELRRRAISVPTIVVSEGWVAPCRLDEFRPLAYLPKPYPLEALLRLVVDHDSGGQVRLPLEES